MAKRHSALIIPPCAAPIRPAVRQRIGEPVNGRLTYRSAVEIKDACYATHASTRPRAEPGADECQNANGVTDMD